MEMLRLYNHCVLFKKNSSGVCLCWLYSVYLPRSFVSPIPCSRRGQYSWTASLRLPVVASCIWPIKTLAGEWTVGGKRSWANWSPGYQAHWTEALSLPVVTDPMGQLPPTSSSGLRPAGFLLANFSTLTFVGSHYPAHICKSSPH